MTKFDPEFTLEPASESAQQKPPEAFKAFAFEKAEASGAAPSWPSSRALDDLKLGVPMSKALHIEADDMPIEADDVPNTSKHASPWQ